MRVPTLGGGGPLVKYVLGAGVAMVLGLPQRQREDLSYLRLMIVHETMQVGSSVSCVCVVDKVIGVVSVVRWRCRAYRCRQRCGLVAVDGPRSSHCGSSCLQHVLGVC